MADTNQTPQSQKSPDSSEQSGEAKAPEQPVSAPEPEEIKQPESSKEARNMAMLCHLLGIVGFFAPLVIWLIEKDKHRFVNEHGRAAMNYQISMMIYFVGVCLFRYVTYLTHDLFIGNWLLNALLIMHIVLVIIAAVKASAGKPWRYPIAIRFLK